MTVFLILVFAFAPGTSGSDKKAETAAKAQSPSSELIREWTDAAGTRHARATLLRVDGQKLWLRNTDGQLASTSLSQLSPADQQYVANHPSTITAVDDQDSSSVSNALGRLPSLKQAKDWLAPQNSDAPRRVVPAALLYVRISRDFLEDYVDRTIHDQKPVSDFILGTRIVGESNTTGQIHLLLRPMFGKLSGEIAFDGTVHAHTTGYNGPAIIHSVSDATFRARKPISMGPAGLNVSAASACAPTDLQTTGIETTLPRLRGRIATRIATRRTESSHDEAQAITSQHTAANISKDLDKRIDQSIARVRKVFEFKVPSLEVDRGRESSTMRFRSTTDYVEMALVREGASSEELNLRPPSISGEPDFAIRANRALLGATIGDSELLKQMAPALVKLLEARVMAKSLAAGTLEAESTTGATTWSIDQNWLVMDFTDPARPASASKSKASK